METTARFGTLPFTASRLSVSIVRPLISTSLYPGFCWVVVMPAKSQEKGNYSRRFPYTILAERGKASEQYFAV